MTNRIATMALESFPSDKEALLDMTYDGIALRDKITEQIGVIGEKVELTDYEKLEAPMVVQYIHMGNKAGVIVALNKQDAKFVEPGRDVAMQVAAMKPIALDRSEVDQSVIEKEIEIGMEVARQEGKPEEMLQKIATGKLQKFFKESTLLEQSFVKDNKMTVADYLKSVDSGLTATAFRHVKLG